jgi:glutaredoxin-like protein NrdH
MTNLDITVYEKPACPACAQTKRNLKRNNIPYTGTDITVDDQAYGYIFNDLGYRQAPVIVVRDEDGNVINHWSGYKFEELESLRELIS